LPGNPVGIEVRELGNNAVALMAKNFLNPNFNRVASLKREQSARSSHCCAGIAAMVSRRASKVSGAKGTANSAASCREPAFIRRRFTPR